MPTDFERQPIEFTEITPRDGEQMEKKDVSIEDRLEVLDAIVRTGVKRIEAGHIGNEVDREFISAALDHIDAKAEEDPRYQDLEIQVLHHSNSESAQEVLQTLEGHNKDRIVLHFYDRLSPNLRDLAEEPYDSMESARRICEAARHGLDAGFTKFSISGEGATDVTVEEAIEFYGYIAEYLSINGATEINLNLANTYGMPPEGEWDTEGLHHFNRSLKDRVPGVTTSVHVHNDDGSANEFSIAAIKAGFDRIEGTLIGMGERCGNVALSDTIIRFLEIARLEVESKKRRESIYRIGSISARSALFETRSIPKSIMDNLSEWYPSSKRMAQIYGTQRRFEDTSLGHPESYNAGSGPHDHASRRALENPARWPLWNNYLRIALIHAMLGRPEAEGIIAADPDAIKAITVNGHAAGGSTRAIVEGTVQRVDSQASAVAKARQSVDEIYAHVTEPEESHE